MDGTDRKRGRRILIEGLTLYNKITKRRIRDRKGYSLLLRRKHHLFPLIPSSHRLIRLPTTVPSLILLFPLDRPDLFGLDLACFLHRLGHVSVASDPPDLGHVGVSFLERVGVLERGSFAR